MSRLDPPGVSTAIVLAAGVGRRIGKHPLPKPLLSLSADGSGPSFLERHARVMQDLGVHHLLLVLSPQVADLGGTIPGATTVINPFDTSSTGSTLSLLCALRSPELPAEGGLLILDADIVYEREVMRHILDSCDRSSLFVSPTGSGDDEEVRVYVDDTGAPTLIGKGLSAGMVAGMSLCGEALGVIHVSADDREVLRSTCEWLVGWPPEREGYGYSKLRSEHEEVWQYLFAISRMGVAAIPAGLLFSECDTPEDYRGITAGLYASILARDSGAPVAEGS